MKDSDNSYQLAELKADVLKTISHPIRLMIVEMLADGELCVCEINKSFGVNHSTISKHLAILKKAGVVADRKEGLKVYYRLEVPCIINFMNCITSVIQSRASKEMKALKSQ